MRLIFWFFLVVLNGTMSSGSGDNEHVHFKIHVPDIIKHHIHTKTIFIHVPKAGPRKKTPKKKEPPKTDHKEEHHKDWSSWNTYDHHETYDDKHIHEKDHSKQRNNNKVHEHREQGHKHYHHHFPSYDFNEGSHENSQKRFPNQDNSYENKQEPWKPLGYNHHSDSYFPRWNSYNSEQQKNREKSQESPQGMVGHSYHPQYAVHEEVNDTKSNEIGPYDYKYEKGYRKGLISQTKHLFEDQSNRFEDSKHEEHDQSKESVEEDSGYRTHAGRYLIDDTEYEKYRDNYKDKGNVSARHKL